MSGQMAFGERGPIEALDRAIDAEAATTYRMGDGLLDDIELLRRIVKGTDRGLECVCVPPEQSWNGQDIKCAMHADIASGLEALRRIALAIGRPDENKGGLVRRDHGDTSRKAALGVYPR